MNSKLKQLLDKLTPKQTVLELGNKRNPNNGPPFRIWYEEQGLKYMCIDWNEKDGCLPLNLTKPINVKLIEGPFDIVTNFGTTEHVSNQQACWMNVHNFLKVGGKLISHTPVGPNWETHGFWHPSLEWYKELAQLNEYKIEFIEQTSWFNSKTRKVINCRLRKVNDLPFTFPTREIHRTSKKFEEEFNG